MPVFGRKVAQMQGPGKFGIQITIGNQAFKLFAMQQMGDFRFKH